MTYLINLYDNRDGTATLGVVETVSPSGLRRIIGETRYKWHYPRSVRAATSAENLVHRHAKANGIPRKSVTIIRA